VGCYRSMRREILPATPLRLSRRYRNNRLTVTLLFAGFGLCFLLAGLALGVRELRAFAREQAIWDKGQACDGGSLRPVISEETELAIVCPEADGVEHHGRVTLYNIGIDAALAGEPEVRYDPEAADEFAISTAIARMHSRRWVTTTTMCTVGGIALLLAGIGLLFWRRYAIARRLARSGDEGVVHVVRVTTKMRKGVATHVRRVYWKLDPADKKVRKTTMDANHGLAWLDSHQPKALALVGGGHAILLAGDLSPLDFDCEDERAAARARLERDGGGLPRGLGELADWIVLSPPKPQ
jgi:hypothetical protein